MEIQILQTLLTFIVVQPIVAGVLILFFTTVLMIAFVIIMLSISSKYIDEQYDIKKKWQNRSFGFLEDTLENIVTITYKTTLEALSIKTTCIENNRNCSSPAIAKAAQELLFYYVLGSIFNVSLKARIKDDILKNGYHFLSDRELENYIDNKSSKYYTWVMLEIKFRLKGVAPDILKVLGKGNMYSESEGRDSFKSIIMNDLSNETAKNKEIKELRQRRWKIWK